MIKNNIHCESKEQNITTKNTYYNVTIKYTYYNVTVVKKIRLWDTRERDLKGNTKHKVIKYIQYYISYFKRYNIDNEYDDKGNLLYNYRKLFLKFSSEATGCLNTQYRFNFEQYIMKERDEYLDGAFSSFISMLGVAGPNEIEKVYVLYKSFRNAIH